MFSACAKVKLAENPREVRTFECRIKSKIRKPIMDL